MLVCRYFLFQAEDGIRDLVRSRGLGDVYKRQIKWTGASAGLPFSFCPMPRPLRPGGGKSCGAVGSCLLYTSDAADERSSVDLGGRRIIKKKTDEATANKHCNEQNIHERNQTEITE